MIATLVLLEPSWIEEAFNKQCKNIIAKLNVLHTYLLLIFLSLQIIIPFRHFFSRVMLITALGKDFHGD